MASRQKNGKEDWQKIMIARSRKNNDSVYRMPCSPPCWKAYTLANGFIHKGGERSALKDACCVRRGVHIPALEVGWCLPYDVDEFGMGLNILYHW